MAKRSRKAQKSQAKLQELAIVAFAEDWEQAKDRETLLKNNDIPAMIKQQDQESADGTGFVVMVPEEYLDEAHVIIESQDAYDDFYDFTLEDNDDNDFDSDLLEDSF